MVTCCPAFNNEGKRLDPSRNLLETKPAAVWFHLTGENPDVTV